MTTTTIEPYLNWKKSELTPASFDTYKRWVVRFLEFCNKTPRRLKLEDIVNYRNYLRSDRAHSPKNIQMAMSVLHDFIKFQMSVCELKFPIHLFKVKNERPNSHYAITDEEHMLMMEYMKVDSPKALKAKLMLSLLYDTGIRINEMLSMKIEDLLENGAVIRNEKNSESRVVFWGVYGETRDLFSRYLHILKASNIKSGHLFISLSTGKPLKARGVERMVKIVATKATGNERICPHSYRHGFIHRKLREGLPEAVISQMVGHTSLTTLRHYARLSSRELTAAWGYGTEAFRTSNRKMGIRSPFSY